MMEGFDALPVSSTDIVRLMLLNQWYTRVSNIDGAAHAVTAANTAFNYGKSYVGSSFINGFSAPAFWVYPVGAQTEGYYGGRVLVGDSHQGAGFLCFFDAANGTVQFSVSWNTFGILKAWRGEPGTGTQIGQSAFASFFDDAWFFLEVFCEVANSGNFEVRVNTVPVMNYVSVDTQVTGVAGFDSVGFGQGSTAYGNHFESWLLDDLYFCDPTGSVNNTFLGNVRVKTQFATGAGSHTGMTIGGSAPAATNWQSVLDVLLGATKFVKSPTAGDYDLYAMDPIINAPLVHGVQVRGAYRQNDATQRISRNLLKSGGTLVEGADNYLNQSFAVHRDIWDLNPDTGLAWTGTEVNAIEVGPKVQA